MANGEPEQKNFGWYAFYKPDRTLAILGIIGIALAAMWFREIPKEGYGVVGAAIAGLIGYLGNRANK